MRQGAWGAHCDANREGGRLGLTEQIQTRACFADHAGRPAGQREAGVAVAADGLPGLEGEAKEGAHSSVLPGDSPRRPPFHPQERGRRPALPPLLGGHCQGNPRAPVHAGATARTGHGRLRLETHVSHD